MFMEEEYLNKMSSFFEDIFSKHQCGFKKSFIAQKNFLTLLEKWKNSVDKGKIFGALLTISLRHLFASTTNFLLWS